jgi:hypothetical protein
MSPHGSVPEEIRNPADLAATMAGVRAAAKVSLGRQRSAEGWSWVNVVAYRISRRPTSQASLRQGVR